MVLVGLGPGFALAACKMLVSSRLITEKINKQQSNKLFIIPRKSDGNEQTFQTATRTITLQDENCPSYSSHM